MALLEKQLEVKQSTLTGAGLGLFTTKLIVKGSRIIEYKGEIKTWKEVENDYNNFYIFHVTDDHVIDGQKSKSLARYINDAKGLTKVKGITNNAQFVIVGMQVFVVATKSIEPGAEIFIGYGKEYWQIVRKNNRVDAGAGKRKHV